MINFGTGAGTGANTGIQLDLTKSSTGIELDLTKQAGGQLNHVRFGGIFDPVMTGVDLDLDVSAFALQNGHLLSCSDVCFYNNRVVGNWMKHSIDARNGNVAQGDDEDEWINIDLTSIPANYDKIILLATIDQASSRSQTFGAVRTKVVLTDKDTNKKLTEVTLSNDYAMDSEVIIGSLDRKGAGWVFTAIGEGSLGKNIGVLANQYV